MSTQILSDLIDMIDTNTSLSKTAGTIQGFYFSETPVDATIIKPTGGAPNKLSGVEYINIYQYMVMSRAIDIQDALAANWEVYNYMHKTPKRNFVLGSNHAYSIKCNQSPSPLDTDEAGRYLYMFTFDLDLSET